VSGSRHVVAIVLLGAGVAIEVLAVIGVTVMRNIFDRLHYVGLAGFGALLVGSSILVQEGFSLIGDKAIAIGLVIVVLSPVMVHTTARSLRAREYGDWRAGIEDHAGEDRG
jgi:multicomponent Na+:H+ antiporter subunit G